MNDPNLRPPGESGPDRGYTSGVSHLADYWQIVTRRMWLILLIFGVTTASAIWAVSQQQTFHRSTLSLQVNDPMERTRSLVPQVRISSMSIYIDPVQSEMEVLKSATIASEVVQRLGLRLRPTAPELVRSSLFRDAWVSESLPDGRFELLYDPSGERAQLRDEDGTVLGSAAVGSELNAGDLRFVLRPPPQESRSYGLQLSGTRQVTGEIQNGLSSIPRINTNIIDIGFIHADQVLAPEILNEAVLALRAHGAVRVKEMALRELEFIESRLDSARVQLDESMTSIRAFKESQTFTNLSFREQTLVTRNQELVEQMEAYDRERSVYASTLRKLVDGVLSEADLVDLTAELAGVQTAQLSEMIRQLQDAQARLRLLLTSEGKTLDHPDARAIRSQIGELEIELQQGLVANQRVVEARLETMSRQLQEVISEQRAFPALENRLQTLEVQQKTDEEQYRYLLNQLQQARITEAAATPYVDVIDSAFGSSPIQPRGRINLLLGALLGMILGVGAAFFLEYLDRTVRTSSDVETLLGIPVLGVIPRLRKIVEEEMADAGRRRRGPMVVALDPVDPAAEAYRNLRMNLMFMSTPDAAIRTIAISSPGPEEGKSTTALNFAIMLAQQGQRVLLVDADLRRPSLHRALDLLREPGLTNLLVGEVESREAIRPNVLPNMDFLPSGPFPPNPSELLSSKAMQRLLGETEGRYAYVVIDTPPVLAVTDAALLGSHTDGILLVLRSGETEQRAAERAVDQLRRIGVRVFGAVLNEVTSASSDESYYLQYYHTYQPSERSKDRDQGMLSKVRFW